MTQPSADTLFEKIKQGDELAFAALYDQYAPALYGVVSKILRHTELTEDVVQDSFVKIWKNIRKYDSKKGSPFTWMLNIARNGAIDRLRKTQNFEDLKNRKQDENVGLLKHLEAPHNVDAIGLKELVNKLTPECQVMVDYIYFRGFTQSEVSEALDMPLGTVKTRARKAIQELRKAFISLFFWI